MKNTKTQTMKTQTTETMENTDREVKERVYKNLIVEVLESKKEGICKEDKEFIDRYVENISDKKLQKIVNNINK